MLTPSPGSNLLDAAVSRAHSLAELVGLVEAVFGTTVDFWACHGKASSIPFLDQQRLDVVMDLLWRRLRVCAVGIDPPASWQWVLVVFRTDNQVLQR